MKKWGIIVLLAGVITVLYLAEFRRVEFRGARELVDLDHLVADANAARWEPFYRVRATIIDGQTVRFNIPRELQQLDRQAMEMTGAALFTGTGCDRSGDTVTIGSFFLLPSTGLVEACEIQPDMELRWTIAVNLRSPWILHYEEMIGAMVEVSGLFRIDTTRPFEPAFYLEGARSELIRGEGDY